MTRDWPSRCAQDCADLTEVVVPSGHWMAQEKPAEVNAALAKWLAPKLPALWPVGQTDMASWHNTSLLTMSRMEAISRNARALWLRLSQSLLRRRQRFSQASVLSTTQRLGSTMNPLTRSERLTISTDTLVTARL